MKYVIVDYPDTRTFYCKTFDVERETSAWFSSICAALEIPREHLIAAEAKPDVPDLMYNPRTDTFYSVGDLHKELDSYFDTQLEEYVAATLSLRNVLGGQPSLVASRASDALYIGRSMATTKEKLLEKYKMYDGQLQHMKKNVVDGVSTLAIDVAEVQREYILELERDLAAVKAIKEAATIRVARLELENKRLAAELMQLKFPRK